MTIAKSLLDIVLSPEVPLAVMLGKNGIEPQPIDEFNQSPSTIGPFNRDCSTSDRP